MRVMKARDQDPQSTLDSFGEIVARDPFFLIGKESPNFQFVELTALRFASVAEVPTPWMCLQHDLRLAGVDPERVERIADRTMEQNYAALRADEIDVMQGFEPYVSMAERDGAGVPLYAASTRGPTVYTAFIATGESIARNRDAYAAMLRAVAAMLDWIATHPAEELADAVAPYFPLVPIEILRASLARYREARLWARTPAMSHAGFERLAQSLRSGGFISRMPRYDACVERSLEA
jgi:NitT/TauT family transport system substrate-binding protein